GRRTIPIATVRSAVPTVRSTVPARSTIPIATVPTIPTVPARLRLGEQAAAALREVENLALVQPGFDTDYAVGGVRFREAVIDIGTQGVQRKLPLQIPFAARDFGAVQPARHAHLDPLAAEALGRIDRFAHGAAEGDTLFELQPDGL